MNVLIKGMEMPETCYDCDFHIYHGDGDYVCVATPMFYPMNLANYKGGRKDWCPLVEVPDTQTEKKSLNGDVIDRQGAIDVLSLGKEILSRVLDDLYVVGTDREKYLWGLRLIESNIQDIEELPSAQPEIIRCRDCQKCQIDSIYYDYWCDGRKVWKDHYCGYAERRTDDDRNG